MTDFSWSILLADKISQLYCTRYALF